MAFFRTVSLSEPLSVIDGDGLVLFKARGLEDASSLEKQVQDALAQKAH